MPAKLQKIQFYSYFLSLGLMSSLWQLILLREILTSWRGNELFLNYFFICWLVLLGLSSLISAKKLNTLALGRFIGWYYFLTALVALGIFLVIRLLPKILNFSAEIPDLSASILIIPLTLLPLAALLGLGFAWGARFFINTISTSISRNLNQAYLLEILGFFLGSLFFNFWLVKIIAFKVILLSLIFCLAVNIILLACQRKLFKTVFIILCLATIFLTGYFFNQAPNLENKTANWRFPKEILLASHNSYLGNIAVTKLENQLNFYEQGSLSSPAENLQANEELIHLPLLFLDKPKKILIIGNGWNGLIHQALKYPEAKIFYAELDPEFLSTVYNYLPSSIQKELTSQRVTIINQDAIAYLKNNQEKFDFILSNLGEPTNYQINRFYTKQYFQLLTNHLSQTGVVALSLPYHQENLDDLFTNQYLASIYQPFNQVLKNNLIIPAQSLIIIGVNSDILLYQASDLAKKFPAKNLTTNFLSAPYVKYLLTNERGQTILTNLRNTKVLANTDLEPIAVIKQIINQTEIMQPATSVILNWVLNFRRLIFIILMILPLLFLYLAKKNKITAWPEGKIKLIALFASSLSLIWEIIIIFIWQITLGYIYKEIGLIIALIMLGIFLANFFLYLKLANPIKYRPLIYSLKLSKKTNSTPLPDVTLFSEANKTKILKLYLLASFILTIVLFIFIANLNNLNFITIKIILLFLSLTSGYLSGAIYPLANALYLGKKSTPEDQTGKIYGLELIGGGIILIIFSLFILPFWGITMSAVYLIYWLGLLNYLMIRE
jgi:spermidine synthase